MSNHREAHGDPEHGSEKPLASGLATARSGTGILKTLAIPKSSPFVGRLGGIQAFVDASDTLSDGLDIEREPDAVPGMSLRQQLSLRSFQHITLWKAGLMEGVGTFMLVFMTVWASISPDDVSTLPNDELDYFDNAPFLGPLAGGLSSFLLLTLFTFGFGVTTGAHLNAAITMATFFTRLCSLPRAIIYISFQMIGSTLAGLMVRASYGARNFKAGGCWLSSDIVPAREAFAIEFMGCLVLFFVAFGIGLDPRQRAVIPPSLSPFLVGLTLGTISWMTGYSRYGFGGAGMNPTRCFGAWDRSSKVGIGFIGWHLYAPQFSTQAFICSSRPELPNLQRGRVKLDPEVFSGVER